MERVVVIGTHVRTHKGGYRRGVIIISCCMMMMTAALSTATATATAAAFAAATTSGLGSKLMTSNGHYIIIKKQL